MRLENKVVVITGAGSGLGRVSSRLFAQEGAKVVITDISEVRAFVAHFETLPTAPGLGASESDYQRCHWTKVQSSRSRSQTGSLTPRGPTRGGWTALFKAIGHEREAGPDGDRSRKRPRSRCTRHRIRESR